MRFRSGRPPKAEFSGSRSGQWRTRGVKPTQLDALHTAPTLIGITVRFFLLEPEVAGGVGEHTEMKVSGVRPPVVTRLHYEVEGWQGDDLLEGYPCFLVGPEAAAALAGAGMRSFTLADALITLSPDREHFINHRVLTFRWLQPTGQPGVDDIAVNQKGRLVISEAAWKILQTLRNLGVDAHRRLSPRGCGTGSSARAAEAHPARRPAYLSPHR